MRTRNVLHSKWKLHVSWGIKYLKQNSQNLDLLITNDVPSCHFQILSFLCELVLPFWSCYVGNFFLRRYTKIERSSLKLFFQLKWICLNSNVFNFNEYFGVYFFVKVQDQRSISITNFVVWLYNPILSWMVVIKIVYNCIISLFTSLFFTFFSKAFIFSFMFEFGWTVQTTGV